MDLVRCDDETLGDETVLMRRVRPDQIIHDQEAGRYRPQSLALRDGKDGEVSVYVKGLCTPDSVLEGHVGYSLASVLTGRVRALGCIVSKTPEDPNPAHRVIISGIQTPRNPGIQTPRNPDTHNLGNPDTHNLVGRSNRPGIQTPIISWVGAIGQGIQTPIISWVGAIGQGMGARGQESRHP